jgi:hypothetical protein
MGEIRDWQFPFGQPVQNVVQLDRKPKKVFVLGVYSSAVHARWVGIENKTIVNALAVASEPYVFWRGDNADAIIQQLDIPPELGKLSLADSQFNGPSGIALDKLILKPLGLERIDAWLCDLVPHSCANSSQKAAIERAYIPVAKTFGLPQHTAPLLPSPLTNEKRRNEILDELSESKSSILVLQGDKPIEWFLRHFDDRWQKLSDFGYEEKAYGKLWSADIDGKEIAVLPLAHPRQIARLGRSSVIWYDLHKAWINQYASKLLLD